jgi:Flp pilus assembly protein TadD
MTMAAEAERLLESGRQSEEQGNAREAALSESGKDDEALPYLERAAQACPTDPANILQLGMAHAKRGDVISARRLLTEAKHLDPGERRIDLALQRLSAGQKKERRRKKAA